MQHARPLLLSRLDDADLVDKTLSFSPLADYGRAAVLSWGDAAAVTRSLMRLKVVEVAAADGEERVAAILSWFCAACERPESSTSSPPSAVRELCVKRQVGYGINLELPPSLITRISSCFGQSLARLELGACGITQEGFLGLSSSSLITLDISRNRKISDMSPLATCTALTSLDMGACDQIRDLSPLASCTALATLDMGECNQISDLSPLASCPALTSLNMGYCDQISDDQRALLSCLPGLKIST